MALLAEAGRPVARHKEIWLFESPSATQRKWLRSKRMLEGVANRHWRTVVSALELEVQSRKHRNGVRNTVRLVA